MFQGKMLQARLVEPEKFILEEVPVPPPKEDEVVLSVSYAGICGSDIHIYQGKDPLLTFPVVPGHEFDGFITDVGSKVRDIGKREPVVVIPSISCGRCYYCRHNKSNLCENLRVIGATGYHGGFAQYARVPAENVIKIPSEVELEEAVFTEPLAAAVNAVKKVTNIREKKVMIVGSGTIGLMVLQVAKIRGARKLISLDLVEEKLKLARNLGADGTVKVSKENLNMLTHQLRKEKIDAVFECVGLESTTDVALDVVKSGGEIVLVGEHVEIPRVKLLLIENRELIIFGTCIYIKKDFLEALEFLEKKRIETKLLISKKVSLAKIDQVFREIQEGKSKAIKTLIVPNLS